MVYFVLDLLSVNCVSEGIAEQFAEFRAFIYLCMRRSITELIS